MKGKIMAWALAFCIVFLSVPMQEHAKDMTPKEANSEAEVTEVSDLDSFAKAAASDGDELSLSRGNPWRGRRLLVKSEKEFDAMGASGIVRGYEDIVILEYDSEYAAKQAYDCLKKNPDLAVEADEFYGTDSVAEEAGAKENERNLSKRSADAQIPSENGEVRVAVIDTGYDWKSYGSERLTDGADFTGSNTIQDENGHGTAMANLILEHTPKGVSIMPVKAADAHGTASSLRLYMGIRYAIEHQADIILISMSAHTSSGSEILNSAIVKAREAGIAVIVSAGNAGSDVSDFSPANAKEAIVVSAVGRDRKIAEYSNYGELVDYCAYGTMEAFGAGGKKEIQTGTSVAAAFVSAAAAEQKLRHKNASYEAWMELLDNRVQNAAEPDKKAWYGKGLLLPESLKDAQEKDGGEIKEPKEAEKLCPLLSCDWKNVPPDELNDYIGNSSNLERSVFLARLNEEETQMLLSMRTLFSEHVIYSENSFDETGNTTETYRVEGTLYDLVKNDSRFSPYETQAKKYHVFAYGSKTGKRSCIRLDTDANKNDAVIYCWMQDRSSDNQNSGAYGLTFVGGESAYDFSKSTHKIENCDVTDFGNPVVWRLKIRNIKIGKPENMAVNYNAELWNKSNFSVTGTTVSGWKAHYWYVYHYQVKPASDADRQKAYGDGSYHGGFWDLKDASGKKCGNALVTTSVDIGTRDLYTDEKKAGITYRLPLVAHKNKSERKDVTDAVPTCTQKGARHTETVYSCAACNRNWLKKGNPVEIAQLSHVFAAKTTENNGIASGKYWEECTRNCGGKDVNGEFWQKNVKYLQPVRYWQMKTDGSYPAQPDGTERTTDYYEANALVPQWMKVLSEEFQAGRADAFLAPSIASYHDIYIPRKQYDVVYDGNGAKKGVTKPQRVYCGESFDLRENGFVRDGYQFDGWSKTPGGVAIQSQKVKNLSLVHNQSVTLYAKWKPNIIKITLNAQGANQQRGTPAVYEQFATGYYQTDAAVEKFEQNKIMIPKKERKDDALPGGIRKQQFLGYFTGKNQTGFRMTQKDGTLLADINGAGNYQYFTKNSAVYAGWEDMYAVQFHPNLSEEDRKFLGKDENGADLDTPALCPYTRWKAKGESITIGFGEAKIRNKKLALFYRFLGWSLTPEISSRDELILDAEKCAVTFWEEKDVTLYAQWDTSFQVAYMGNGQTKGADFTDASERISDAYAFAKNPFEKTVERPGIEIATGNTKTEDEKPYMETVPCSFQGYGLGKETDASEEDIVFSEEEVWPGTKIMLAAYGARLQEESHAITFGRPASDFEASDAPVLAENEKTPFVNLYARWDEYPQIHATDCYVSLADAKDGILTEAYLLSLAEATDEELKSDENPRGVMKSGENKKDKTSFTILDYQKEDFLEVEDQTSLTVTYRAKDRVGNVTTKMVRVYFADTSGKQKNGGSVRFISKEYADTLAKNSIWRTGDYAKKLERTLSNQKTKEEYTSVTPLQKALGVKPVKKPGSGTWSHVREIWEFSHKDVLEIQAYAEKSGGKKDAAKFLEKFGRCRVQ